MISNRFAEQFFTKIGKLAEMEMSFLVYTKDKKFLASYVHPDDKKNEVDVVLQNVQTVILELEQKEIMLGRIQEYANIVRNKYINKDEEISEYE